MLGEGNQGWGLGEKASREIGVGKRGHGLAAVVTAAVRRWQAEKSGWMEVDWTPEANLAPAVAITVGLEAALLGRLWQLERTCARRRRLGGAVVRCWVDERCVSLELRGETEHFRWRFRREAARGGSTRGIRRGRVVLPAAAARWRSRAWRRGWEAACLVTASPGIVEQARGLLEKLPIPGVWSHASARRAGQWLEEHPRCRLLMVDDRQVPGTTGEGGTAAGWPGSSQARPGGEGAPGRDQLWVGRPGGAGAEAVWIKIPVNAQELLGAARKICVAGERVVEEVL